VHNVIVEELLNKAWPIHDDVEREEIDRWDWDELMAMLGLECPDCCNLDIVIKRVTRHFNKWFVWPFSSEYNVEICSSFSAAFSFV
jgi:hypothetical protein